LNPSYAPDTPAVVAYRVGWPDELLLQTTLARLADDVKAAGISRQALIMLGDVFGAQSNKTLKKSKLYDESFSHGFRKV